MATGWRAALVVVVALVAGAIGATGAYAFHWHVIQPSDAELLATAPDLTLPGFVVDWGPGVSGKWAPSLDRGYVRMGVSSDGDVALETIAADLQETGWAVHTLEKGKVIDDLYADKGAVRLAVTRRVDQSGPTNPAIKRKDRTIVEFMVDRGDQSPSLTTTVRLGALLAASVGGALTVWLPRRLTASRAPTSALTWF